ncbi:hypothetical protein LXM94_25500 [Rhizobium sp. TRM95111]|uniref:hypothetical protein n=1 Tax=Rhizobium alarense TaxID=2846851 RepID=UPI001F204D66|nr:hypothetical protein [Rhizobium alarense]MCF3643313.1 hypothetical protein [Rhizobium alarense]
MSAFARFDGLAVLRRIHAQHSGQDAGELNRAIENFAELIAAARQAELFVVYLLTHAPELPDENRTVRRLRAALIGVGNLG